MPILAAEVRRLRQRHAEAVKEAYEHGFADGCAFGQTDWTADELRSAWLASDAKARLT